MNTRIQRLCSVTKVIPRAQRSFTTSTPHHAWEDHGLAKSHTAKWPKQRAQYRNVYPETLDKDSKVQRYFIGDERPEKPILSEVHWALSPAYKVGGKVEEGLTPKEAWDDTNDVVPRFNEDRVMIKIQSASPATIMHLPNFWLRDNCRCSQCVNQDTMQRALDTFSMPETIKPKKVTTEKEGLQVTWDNDDHVSTYEWDWLLKHRKYSKIPIPNSPTQTTKPIDRYKLWGGDIDTYINPPSVSYDEIMADDKGVGKWTAKIREYGFCYVDGCPVSPEKTQELLERIAFIRPTHYGGFYDFTSDLTMKDTAYTSLALPAHTDTTYFTDPAGLQMFHLLSHSEGQGGSSLLVDGFEVARLLRTENLEAYRVLRDTPIQWHASGNEGITITPSKKFPVLNFGNHKKGSTARDLLQVRWNNDDRGVVDLFRGLDKTAGHVITAERWYWAARKWDEILRRKTLQYWAQLEPGRPLIFDNWRVMHGRSAFTGKRRICGGYINHDDFISRWRNTNFTKEEVKAQIL